MNRGRFIVLFVFLIGLAVSGFVLFLHKTTPDYYLLAYFFDTPNHLPLIPVPPPPNPPQSPPPLLPRGAYDSYGTNDILAIDIGVLIAKRVPGGIIVRRVDEKDEKGVFTAIAYADDFHRLTNSDGGRTPYFQAGDTVYMFKYADIVRTSHPSLLPVPMSIPDADASTFMPGLSPHLSRIAKDKTHVYINGILDPIIDAKTVAVIPQHPDIFQDSFHVYKYTGQSLPYTITPFEPPITFFSPLANEDSEFSGHFTDKNNAYFQDRKIEGVDLRTFTVFTTPKLGGLKGSGPIYSYAKDKNSVYYEGIAVPYADPATFVPVDNGGVYSYYYGKDMSRVYEGITTIPTLDPSSVQVLWQPIYEGCMSSHYVKDATHVFFQQTVVPNADPDTFKTLINGYGRDKNGIWEGTSFRPDLPKDFQPVCNYG